MSEKKKTVRLALMRTVPKKWDCDGNFDLFLESLRQADADIFITPECWLDGYAARGYPLLY